MRLGRSIGATLALAVTLALSACGGLSNPFANVHAPELPEIDLSSAPMPVPPVMRTYSTTLSVGDTTQFVVNSLIALEQVTPYGRGKWTADARPIWIADRRDSKECLAAPNRHIFADTKPEVWWCSEQEKFIFAGSSFIALADFDPQKDKGTTAEEKALKGFSAVLVAYALMVVESRFEPGQQFMDHSCVAGVLVGALARGYGLNGNGQEPKVDTAKANSIMAYVKERKLGDKAETGRNNPSACGGGVVNPPGSSA
jgi:hypothetical protein